MIAAAAAPKPLPILTVSTPGAQLASAERSAARPPAGDAVADRGGQRDDRRRDQAGHHAEQRALHAGRDDEHARCLQRGALGQDAPQPRHADIRDNRRRIAVEFQRARCLPRRGEIRGARRDQQRAGNEQRARQRRPQDGRAGERIEIEARAHVLRQRRMLLRREPGQQQAALQAHGLGEDRGELRGRLRLAEHRLGDARARLAIPVEQELAHARSCRKAAPRRYGRMPRKIRPSAAQSARAAAPASAVRITEARLHHNAGMGHAAPDIRAARQQRRERPFHGCDEGEILAPDRNAGLDAARKAGLRGEFRDVLEAECVGKRPHGALAHARLHEGVAHAVLGGGGEAGPVIGEIVEIGARGDRAIGHPGDARIEIGLAEIAAIDRVRAIGWVAELAGIELAQPPAEARGMVAHARAGLGRHRGRDRVHHGEIGQREAMRGMGERHAVHAAAHRDGDARQAGEHGIEIGRHASSSAARLAARRASSPAIAARSSLSAFRLAPSARSTRLTRTPHAACADSRGSTCRRSCRQRNPMVEVSARQADATASRRAGSTSRRKLCTGRFFLPRPGVSRRSRTPASARSRSAAMPISSPVMSSTSKLSTTISSSVAAPASALAPAVA